MRYSPLTHAALNLVRSAIDRVWPEQIAYAWDSKPPALIGAAERPTHMLITSWAIDQLKTQFPELNAYRGDIIDGANATELHELPLKPDDLEVGRKYGLDLEAKRKEHKGTNAGTDDIVGWWNDALTAFRSGQKARGYFILGIMLHMIEDMGVPSHARGIYHQAPSLREPLQFDNFEMMGFSNWKPSFDNINRRDPNYGEPWRYYGLSQEWTNQDTPSNFTRDGFSKTWFFASTSERQLLSNRQGRTCHVVMWTLRSASLAIAQIYSPGALVGQLAGTYECHVHDTDGHKNDWHYVTITRVNDTTMTWSNRAGQSWTLTTSEVPNTLGVDCRFYPAARQATIQWDGSRLVGINWQGELYTRKA